MWWRVRGGVKTCPSLSLSRRHPTFNTTRASASPFLLALPAIKHVSDTVHKETILGNGTKSITGAEALDLHALEEEFVEIPLEEFGGSVVGDEDIESAIEESLDEAVKNINERLVKAGL